MIEIPQAIQSLYPEAEFAGPANDGGYDDVRWHIKPDGITKAKVDAEIVRLQTEWDAQEYARDRKAEYDALNQFELMTDDAANSTTTHADAIEAIKKKYPKG